MTLTSDQVFLSGLDHFGGVVDRLDAADWDRPSPCAGWTALDVLGHLGSALEFGTAALRGEQYAWPESQRPAELVSGEPAAYWRRVAAESRAALATADLELVVETPMGPRTVADRLAFPAIDLYVHAWDIAAAAGLQANIPAEVIEFTHGYIDPFPPEVVRGDGGAFGPEVEVADDASETERFLAWTGRDPAFTPSDLVMVSVAGCG